MISSHLSQKFKNLCTFFKKELQVLDFGLEIATALIYIVKRDEPDLSSQKDQIITYLLLLKPWLDKNKVELIFNLLFFNQKETIFMD